MALSIGIVGLPNVGKSTLFKAVTNKQVDIQNYPFTTIEPNVGVVEVPDERVGQLAELSESAKKIYATVQFTDIAGLVKGAAQGEGLGNKFLANIREVEAIVEVVRAFETGNIHHVHGQINPASDIEVINAELMLADLDTVTRRIEKEKKVFPALDRLRGALEQGTLLARLDLNDEERLMVRELNLLTAKPFIYVFNVAEDQLNSWQPNQKLLQVMEGSAYLVMSNKLELELSEMNTEDKTSFLKDLGLPESGLDRLIKEAYSTLGLVSFLTTGPKESRAWTCQRGDTLPVASRAIHNDFERLFIRGEVINWQELLKAGGHAQAKTKGLIKTVGRDYVVQDGDVVEILISH